MNRCIALLCLLFIWQPQALAGEAADAAYQHARDQISARQFSQALATLRQLQREHRDFPHMHAVQARIAVLHESKDAGDAVSQILEALDLRDAGDIDACLQLLDKLSASSASSTLADDALYLSAYVQIMDRYDFAAARTLLASLKQHYPDSAYRDSIDYLDAIALEQQGQTEAASLALQQLRDRHTALSLPFGFHWPRGNLMSRYWFDRTDRRLAMVEQRLSSASTLRRREITRDDSLRVSVSVDGIDMDLILSASPMVRATDWRNGLLQDQLPPQLGVYTGFVEGAPDSWVRAVLTEDSITGWVSAYGRQHVLHPGTLVGTLNYYRPLKNQQSKSSGSAGQNLRQLPGDALLPPAEDDPGAYLRRAIVLETDLRVVPISVVIDSQFDRFYSGAGLANALNNLNVADGLYRQFGLSLSLQEAVIFDDEQTDPMNMGPTTLETLLRTFRDYRLMQQTLFADSALTYLFTGNPRTDPTLGLAWIDTACRADGYDVGVTTPSSFGDLLLSHELGHSLGAEHDSDTVCSTDSRQLMWPNISSRTRATFSECSEQQVLESRAKTCLINAIDLALLIHADAGGVRFEMINTDTRNTVDATLIVETSDANLLQWPAGCQPLTPTSAQCAISRLAAQEHRFISMPVASAHSSAVTTTAAIATLVTGHLSVSVFRDIDEINNVASASLDGDGVEQYHLPVSAASDEALAQNTQTTGGSGSASWLWALMLFYSALVWVFKTRPFTQRNHQPGRLTAANDIYGYLAIWR